MHLNIHSFDKYHRIKNHISIVSLVTYQVSPQLLGSYFVVKYGGKKSKQNEDDQKHEEKSSPHGEVILQDSNRI